MSFATCMKPAFNGDLACLTCQSQAECTEMARHGADALSMLISVALPGDRRPKCFGQEAEATAQNRCNAACLYRCACQLEEDAQALKKADFERRAAAHQAAGATPQKSESGQKYDAHYTYVFKGVRIDPYRIMDLYKITHPAHQHAVKKLLRAGRSVKDLRRDIEEVRMTLDRWLAMLDEEGAGNAVGA
jgi:hypothetical protein